MDNIREELIKYHKEYETDKEGLDHAEAAINDLEKGREVTNVPGKEGEDLYLGQYRTIGNGITTKYIKEGGIEIIGAQINEPEDLAALMQAYRNPLFETTRVFYLQKNKVVAVEGISSRLPDLVIMEFTDADMPGEHYAMAAERYGADSFYLMHNHPSGNPTPSLPDRQLTVNVAKASEKFAGHVVINHQRYAVIDGDGNYELTEMLEKTEDPFLTPSLEHPLLGTEVDTVEKLAEVGRELEAADQSGISYLLYNSGNTIRGLQEVDSRILLDEQFPQWLRMQMESFGSGSAVCITSNPDTYLQMDSLIRQAYLADVIYLDPELHFYWSRYEDNIAPDSKYAFAGVTEPDTTRFYEEYDKTGRRQWSYTPQPGISRLFIDLDGTLAVFTPVDQIETLYEEGYFRNLKPHGNVIEGVKFFMKANPQTETYIMSSVLVDSRYAENEKNAWVDQHLSEIDRDHRIFPPCGENKADYVPGGIRKTDILLDDYTDNLLSWKEQGGTGIKLMNGINGTKGRWDGRKIDGSFFPEGIASMLGTAVRRAERETILTVKEPVTGYPQKQFEEAINLGNELSGINRPHEKEEDHKMGKKELTDYTGSCAELMATYEELYQVPVSERITSYRVDDMLYVIRPDITMEEAEKLYDKALKAIGLTATAYEVNDRYASRMCGILDMCKENHIKFMAGNFRENITLNDFLEAYPNETIHASTPGGFVDYIPEQISEVLDGNRKNIKAHPGDIASAVNQDSDEILGQYVSTGQYIEGSWNLLTDYYPEEYKGLENDKDKKGTVMENNQINTVVVNAFGGPGVGKTTCSWEIASELKKQGLCVEYVSEYAKELVWDDNLQMLDGTVEHQKILLDEQEKRIQRLIGKADVVVTDSPLLLNLTYCRDCPEDYKQEVLERFNSYNNFCFLVKRDPSLDFEDRGRIHNLEESIEKDKEIQSFLRENGIYHGIYSHAQSKILVRNIMTSFNRLNQSQQKRYIEKEPDMKNTGMEPTFEEKKGMFQSMSYEEQFKTVLEAEMPETRGQDRLQEDLYQEYMRSDQAGFFGNQLHKQFRDKIQERTRQKVTNKDINLE